MRCCREWKNWWSRNSRLLFEIRLNAKTPELALRRAMGTRLRRHGPALSSAGFANGGDATAHIQPSLFLEQLEEVVSVGNFAGDDFFPALLVGHGEGDLHGLIRRVLFGEMDEFYVERFLLLRL